MQDNEENAYLQINAVFSECKLHWHQKESKLKPCHASGTNCTFLMFVMPYKTSLFLTQNVQGTWELFRIKAPLLITKHTRRRVSFTLMSLS